MTTGASPLSISISMDITARCRSVKETIRLVRMRTCLLDGVVHRISRRSTPSRKSMLRS